MDSWAAHIGVGSGRIGQSEAKPEIHDRRWGSALIRANFCDWPDPAGNLGINTYHI